ncbi:hypothetical protein FH972_023112 [Carpinus fangiana]|uniref:Uncharacterized protein n=1 Tax=Carpinus fangiana TaxID=176857 RepID=A0A5N6KU81_9ROSI|nr:hypothetical protein FH972_023112 [Carpinus fangiana]
MAVTQEADAPNGAGAPANSHAFTHPAVTTNNGQLPSIDRSDTKDNQTNGVAGSTVRSGHTRNRSSSAPMRTPVTKAAPLTSRSPNAGTPKRHLLESGAHDNVQKLSPSEIFALTSDPDSLPIRAMTPDYAIQETPDSELHTIAELHAQALGSLQRPSKLANPTDKTRNSLASPSLSQAADARKKADARRRAEALHLDTTSDLSVLRPAFATRTSSTPASAQRMQPLFDSPADVSTRAVHANGAVSGADKKTSERSRRHKQSDPVPDAPPSPLSHNLPLPPLSMPTYLDLELSTDRPSQLYIRRDAATDVFYESTKVKLERLRNFLILPPQLENVLFFGALTCLDAWLYTFTILPIRFVKAAWIYLDWLSHNALNEAHDNATYVYRGLGRLWYRHRRRSSVPAPSPQLQANGAATPPRREGSSARRTSGSQRPADSRRGSSSQTKSSVNTHRTRSKPSLLKAEHKADLLQGLLIFLSCMVLMKFDASRMYHAIRGQSAIKLYVIYNVLEVFDRLFSALGQDILECLFSDDLLERNSHGRSHVFQPFWMFILALVYTVCHATALFYQVVTLNVAVNSYSNALLTLLMSNQFVEIKGTVFKKFEKEIGGLSITTSEPGSSSSGSSGSPGNESDTGAFSTFNILPASFTLLASAPVLQVLSPFLIVLASEMVVDWLKHAYITKFNATSPKIYGRFFDILAKDYYANVFSPPFASVTRRLGLPILPLACLFIRAAVQTPQLGAAAAGVVLDGELVVAVVVGLACCDRRPGECDGGVAAGRLLEVGEDGEGGGGAAAGGGVGVPAVFVQGDVEGVAAVECVEARQNVGVGVGVGLRLGGRCCKGSGQEGGGEDDVLHCC